MADLLEKKVKAIKSKIEEINVDIERLEKDNAAGMLSPLEKMRISSRHQEKKELQVKLKELLM